MGENMFTFNLACTVPVNPEGVEPVVNAKEFWTGLRRGGARPELFAEYVAKTEVMNQVSDLVFQRRLHMADGAVHTKGGATIDQDVRLAENLMCEGVTIGNGSRSTMLLSHGAQPTDGPNDLYLTAIYELHVPDVEPGSSRAAEIERDYTKLAKGAANTVVQRIREWKVDNKL
ncbi:Acetylaranotin biosynthesis cluster protein L [Exophiala dermatitidis]